MNTANIEGPRSPNSSAIGPARESLLNSHAE
jgi:hypothetical protein